MRPDGSNPETVIRCGNPDTEAGCEHPALSPDGTKLAFTGGEGVLNIANADGSEAHVPPSLGPGDGASPAWSPQSDRIAFISALGSIETISRDGTGLRTVIPGSRAHAAGSLAWSPDGTKIAFGTRPTGSIVPQGELDVVPAAGGSPKTILTHVDEGVAALSWAPATGLLVQNGHEPGISETDEQGNAHLAYPVDTCSDPDCPGGSPSWAPDGVHYSAIDDAGRLVIATVAGGVERTISPPRISHAQGIFYAEWGGPPSISGSLVLTGRYVAMGDSYSSGEGSNFPNEAGCSVPTYQDPAGNPPDTDRLGGSSQSAGVLSCFVPSDAKGNVCHRSVTAYPHVLLDDLGGLGSGLTLVFVACSGAHTDDVLNPYDQRSQDGRHQGERAQLDHLGPDVALVTISIGGNDLDFAGTAKDCVTGTVNPVGGSGPCFGHDDALVCTLLKPPDRECPGVSTSLRDTWINLFRQIRARAPSAVIEVLGYPRFFALGGNSGGCEHFTQLEERWIDDRIKLVDETLQDAVGLSGVANYVDVYNAFDGKEECTDQPDINGINLLGGYFGTPENLHPNPAGHREEAAILAEAVRGETGLVPASETWNVAAGTSGRLVLDHQAGGRRETIAVAPSVAGKPSKATVTITDSVGQTLAPVVDTGTETVWDIPSAADSYTLHVDNTKSTSALTAAVQEWVSHTPTVVRGAVMIPLGPNYCSGQNGGNTCMDVLIAQPRSAAGVTGYTLYGGGDPLQRIDAFESATPHRIESVPCLSDVVLQTEGGGGAFSAWNGTPVLSCSASQGSLQVGSTTASAGTSIDLNGTGFAPGAPVAAVLMSTPVVLGTTTADNKGRAQGAFIIPAGVPTGKHTVELVGFAASGHVLRLLSPSITVTPARGSGWLLLGVLLGLGAGVTAGGVLYRVRRRRSKE